MIAKRELENLRTEWSLSLDVIEKDYVLGWLLAGIAQHPALATTWIFKGGTCLRKCYYETFRFSEDLDFTVTEGGPSEPASLLRIFEEVADWIRDTSGLDLSLSERAFITRVNKRGRATALGRIAYRGPNPPPQLPKVKLDITADEVLVRPPVRRLIGHVYSDRPLPGAGVNCYSIVELFGEKLRALAQRCRPRDLYDVVHLHRHPDLLDQAPAVMQVLQRKCDHAGIDVPTLESLLDSPFRAEIEAEWENMLGHQLPRPLPPFTSFWESLGDVFGWLSGSRRGPQLRAAASDDVDPAWRAPRAITTWRRGVPLELIRYAGANRLKVVIDYRPEAGRVGPRTVEPYAVRRTKSGHLVLFVTNDRGELRSYRLDRIAAVRPTATTFAPRYRIEF